MAKRCKKSDVTRNKTLSVDSQEKKGKDPPPKKKHRKLQVMPKHDDECYKCEEGGELVMCDKEFCTKAYHLHCLELARTPRGRWECPWHFCDVCGESAMYLCALCPKSLCPEHLTCTNMYIDISDFYICDEHVCYTELGKRGKERKGRK